MKTWIITDPHFDHKGIEKWTARKKGFQEMLMAAMFKTIGPDDTLICLGDVSFLNHERWHKWMTSMAKNSILVLGNHEKNSLTWYYKYWNCVCNKIKIRAFGEEIILSHKPTMIFDNEINIHGHFHNNNITECFYHEPELETIYTKRHILISCEELPNVQRLDKIIRRKK